MKKAKLRKGFFSSKVTWKKPSQRMPQCGACRMDNKCLSPKMKVSGKGKKKILIVGEAPGRNEDEGGEPFIGESGKILVSVLRKVGIERDDCWITNSIICRPENNRTPTNKEIEFCRPNVMKAIQELQPTTILLLGISSVKSVIEPIWKDMIGPITRWVGWHIPCQTLNAWITPMYHPAYILRLGNSNQGPVVKRIFVNGVEEAVSLDKKPWNEPPNWERQVKIIHEPSRAAATIRKMAQKGGWAAFDYETDRLKPDNDGSIICCSICWRGKKTIAFPVCGESKKALSEFLRSPNVNKIAANMKFEQRWTQHFFGHNVRNFKWDTIIAAHLEDNRRMIAGLKFQAFVRLGVGDYDSHISKYKSGESSNLPNKLKEISLNELMQYCGMDSLLTYKLFERQISG